MTKSDDFYKLFKPNLTPKQMLAYGYLEAHILVQQLMNILNRGLLRQK